MVNDIEKTAAEAIFKDLEGLSERITAIQYSNNEQLVSKYGPEGRKRCREDVGYHLSYLAEAISASNPAIFESYIKWAKELFAGLKIAPKHLRDNLMIMQGVLFEALGPASAGAIGKYIEAAVRILDSGDAVKTATYIGEGLEYGGVAEKYLTRLLAADRSGAREVIINAVEGGTSVRDIYIYVFQACQREIGRLWQTNAISVAKEHYCTASTQFIMSELYPYIFQIGKANKKTERRMVATCVSGELHEIGIRMVADFLEMDGWDTLYLGSNTPARSVVETVVEYKPQLLAISATMTFHVSNVKKLIDTVRSRNEAGAVKIIVGGFPFNIDGQLWRTTGADGYCADAGSISALAGRLIT